MRAALLVLAVGCESTGYDWAEWEVTVDAPLPAGAETMRICVGGAPVYELGAGNGRAAVTGLRPDDTLVRIEILDDAGQYLAVTETVAVSDARPIATAKLLAPDDSTCVDDGEYAADDEDSRLLAVRFLE